MSESKGTRGSFASMDPERQREIASMGGVASHANGTAHKFTSDEARRGGKKRQADRRTWVPTEKGWSE